MSTIHSVVALVAFLLITGSAGFFGAMYPPGEWYKGLKKPSFTPPQSAFGPVWTTLYILIAVAAWLVWRDKGLLAAGLPLGLFLLQVILNAAWSWIFFGLHSPSAAFMELVPLWLLVVATTVLFWQRVTLAGILMLPYVLWMAFAVVLNFSFWKLNPQE